jgi:hypothetical protein
MAETDTVSERDAVDPVTERESAAQEVAYDAAPELLE